MPVGLFFGISEMVNWILEETIVSSKISNTTLKETIVLVKETTVFSKITNGTLKETIVSVIETSVFSKITTVSFKETVANRRKTIAVLARQNGIT